MLRNGSLAFAAISVIATRRALRALRELDARLTAPPLNPSDSIPFPASTVRVTSLQPADRQELTIEGDPEEEHPSTQ
jgi:hypothetical protein